MEKLIGQYDVVHALTRHIGEENGVHVKDLVREITGEASTPALERRVRHLVKDLRTAEGMAICGRPETGYFIARTQAEFDKTCKFLADRGISHLQQVYKMRGVVMPDFAGQLRLPT
jgi:hypothetical protein